MDIFDGHIHINFDTPVEESIRGFEYRFRANGYKKYAFLSLPQNSDGDGIFSKIETVNKTSNVKALFYKLYFSPNAYAYAGLEHDLSMSDEERADNLLRQAKLYMSVGFDGIKMLEGKPSNRYAVKTPYNSKVFFKFYKFMEENGYPITMHNADPASFWDKSKMSPETIEHGWYADDTLPTKQQMHDEIEDVLYHFPRLKLSMAHCGFMGDEPERAEKFVTYENTFFDVTPGPEQFYFMYNNQKFWQKTFDKYPDKFRFGSDTYNDPLDECKAHPEYIGTKICLDFFSRNTTTEFGGDVWKSMTQNEEFLKKLLYENSAKLLGEPKEINKDFILEKASLCKNIYTDIPSVIKDMEFIESFTKSH